MLTKTTQQKTVQAVSQAINSMTKVELKNLATDAYLEVREGKRAH